MAATTVGTVFSRTRPSTLGMFFNQMQKRYPRPKPGAGKRKIRTRHLFHTKKTYVKLATETEIFHHNGDMINMLDANGIGQRLVSLIQPRRQD